MFLQQNITQIYSKGESMTAYVRPLAVTKKEITGFEKLGRAIQKNGYLKFSWTKLAR